MADFTLLDSIHDIAPQQWDALWQAGAEPDYPFVRHCFLAALEDSGCTREVTGWTPRHLLLHEQGRLIAAMPMYLKSHSYGEYVFDWGWADAYHRHGLSYYPKLLAAIPFTPATGPRLALAAGEDVALRLAQIQAFLSDCCREQRWSGWHCLFYPPEQQSQWRSGSSETHSSLLRIGCQFHWFNRNYQHFDDFLDTFSSRKRKSVRRERRQVSETGVALTRLVGDEISTGDWDRFYHFYHTTYLKRSGNAGYLNREFFAAIARTLGEQILMVKAEYQGETVAAALCFFDDQRLYGRYWGCLEEIPALHFEACYYQGIEFAIERDLKEFDPGAQGEHKIQRGFEPILTCSQHWLADPRFHAAIADFLRQETRGVEHYRDDCASYLPFKDPSAA